MVSGLKTSACMLDPLLTGLVLFDIFVSSGAQNSSGVVTAALKKCTLY